MGDDLRSNDTAKLGWIEKLLALWVRPVALFCAIAGLFFGFAVNAGSC